MSARVAGDRENEGKGKSAHDPPQTGGSCSGCSCPGIGLSRLGRPRFRGGECQRAVRLADNGLVRANGTGLDLEVIGLTALTLRQQPPINAKVSASVTTDTNIAMHHPPAPYNVMGLPR